MNLNSFIFKPLEFPNEGDLKVWWIPQIPMKAFEFSVKDIQTAAFVLEVLAQYDIFQFEEDIKPDYCNTGGLMIFQNDEWIDWYDENGDDIDNTELIKGENKNVK